MNLINNDCKLEFDKWLFIEISILLLSSIILFSLIIVAYLVPMEKWLSAILIIIGFIIFIIGSIITLRIEQKVYNYECSKCYHKYTPKFKNISTAIHIGSTRYMRCPKCNKVSWNKKVK